MKDYMAFILTLILFALVFIGYTLYQNKDSYTKPSKTDDILGNLTPTNLNEELEKSLDPNQPTLEDSAVMDALKNLDAENDVTNPNAMNSQSGNILAGKLCYPTQEKLPLDVYILNIKDKTQFKKKTINEDDPSIFKFENVPAGKYYAFAYAVGNNQLAGGYTKAVPCGLTLDCTDHRMIEITMGTGQIITYADICDWFGTQVPKRPD